jgi:hypothetical protein
MTKDSGTAIAENLIAQTGNYNAKQCKRKAKRIMQSMQCLLSQSMNVVTKSRK